MPHCWGPFRQGRTGSEEILVVVVAYIGQPAASTGQGDFECGPGSRKAAVCQIVFQGGLQNRGQAGRHLLVLKIVIQ